MTRKEDVEDILAGMDKAYWLMHARYLQMRRNAIWLGATLFLSGFGFGAAFVMLVRG
jgi:hypothetical protein